MTRRMLSIRGYLVRLLIAASACGWTNAPVRAQERQGEGAPAPSDTTTIYRYDPLDRLLHPIARSDLRVGNVYNHFSPQLGRRVYSMLQPEGTFWHGFGPGTVQDAWAFDIRLPYRKAVEELGRIRADPTDTLQQASGAVFLELDENGNWNVARSSRESSIFDLQTRQRWFMHRGQYIPIGHTDGYQWRREGRRFVPLE